jgi:hypothetical protein
VPMNARNTPMIIVSNVPNHVANAPVFAAVIVV